MISQENLMQRVMGTPSSPPLEPRSTSERKNLMDFSMKPRRSRSLPPPKQSQRETQGQANRSFSSSSSSMMLTTATFLGSDPLSPSGSEQVVSSSNRTAMRGPSSKAPSPCAIITDRKPWGANKSTVRPHRARNPSERKEAVYRSKSMPPSNAEYKTPPSALRGRGNRPVRDEISVRFNVTRMNGEETAASSIKAPKFQSKSLSARRNSRRARQNAHESVASSAITKTLSMKKFRSSSEQKNEGPTEIQKSGDNINGKNTRIDIAAALVNDASSRTSPRRGSPSPTRRVSRKARLPVAMTNFNTHLK